MAFDHGIGGSARWQSIRAIWQSSENHWLYTLSGFLLGLLIFPLLQEVQYASLLVDLVPEAIGIVFTVAVVERLYRLSEKRQERQRIIREMGSEDRTLASRAVREAWSEGMIADGSLAGADLIRANLAYAELQDSMLKDVNLWRANLAEAVLDDSVLYGADLTGADLSGASLREADLSAAICINTNFAWADISGTAFQAADLRGAVLKGVANDGSIDSEAAMRATFQQADAMRGAILWDGSLYDGRYDLPGDAEAAKFEGWDLSDPHQKRVFYFGEEDNEADGLLASTVDVVRLWFRRCRQSRRRT